MANGEPVISVRGLTKAFKGKVAVNDFSLTVNKGDIHGFLGPNGSGKTTTIRMLCGLLTPDRGEGQCLGYDVRTQQHLIKRRVGYMTQKFSLWEDLTVGENLEFVARMYGLPQRRRAVERIIEWIGLAGRRHALAASLSGGWKQRLALAASLIHEPALLLLDEPTAGVDPKARREFWNHIHQLSREGVTTLVSTHYMDEAERCNKLAYISYGDLLVTGTAEEVVAQSGLVVHAVTGPAVWEQAAALRVRAGVEQVTMFGAALHVSGGDPAALAAAVAPLAALTGYRTERVAPSLEDVFIHLMARRREP